MKSNLLILAWSLAIKETDETTLGKDLSVHLMYHCDPIDFGSLILICVTPKKCTPIVWSNESVNIFLSEQHCIRDLVSSVAKQNDIPLNRETLDMFVLMVLYEACSPVSSSAAKAAVQLLFGRAHLVSKQWLFCYGKIRKESLLWNN